MNQGLVTPANAKGHASLEVEVTDFLRAVGFDVGTLSYHNALSSEMTKKLQRVNDPTALVVRTRSDRVAVHEGKKVSFMFELKTGTIRVGQDFMPEIVQLASHLCEWKHLGARTMYVYRNMLSGFESSFWVGDGTPNPTAILIGWQKAHLEPMAVKWAAPWWPGLRVCKCNMPNSGDPCFRVPQSAMPEKSYQQLVSELVAV